jgi:hypothetical protein
LAAACVGGLGLTIAAAALAMVASRAGLFHYTPAILALFRVLPPALLGVGVTAAIVARGDPMPRRLLAWSSVLTLGYAAASALGLDSVLLKVLAAAPLLGGTAFWFLRRRPQALRELESLPQMPEQHRLTTR